MSLLVELNPLISPNPSSPIYRAISAKKKTGIDAIFFLKDTWFSGDDSKHFWSCYQYYISCHCRGMRSNYKENRS